MYSLLCKLRKYLIHEIGIKKNHSTVILNNNIDNCRFISKA